MTVCAVAVVSATVAALVSAATVVSVWFLLVRGQWGVCDAGK
jgi:hypothetical protein